MPVTYALVLAFAFLYVGGIVAFSLVIESKMWNGGICPKCKVKWEKQSTDASGISIYVCPSCKKQIGTTVLGE